MRLFPKEIDFFEIFDRMAGNVHTASGQLVELLKDFDRIDERVQAIYSIEQQGDMLTHDIIKRLNKTFLTPIDREDIHALADRMDDILDLIWAVADRIKIFKITKSSDEALSMARDLHRTVDVINMAFKELSAKNYVHVQEHCIEINRLENRVDRNYKAALASLFDGDHDPVTIIKWKDIYERLEEACNRCEDVANILEAVLLKHG